MVKKKIKVNKFWLVFGWILLILEVANAFSVLLYSPYVITLLPFSVLKIFFLKYFVIDVPKLLK